MNAEQNRLLNDFFVHIFNQILAWEEQTLKETGTTDLSVREMHVIEAISNLEGTGQNTMANIAKVLCISPGSLTTAVNVLVNKGYLERRYTPKDRRVVFVVPTEKGAHVNALHEDFHRRMCDMVGEELNEEQWDVLLSALQKIERFFVQKVSQARV